MPRAELPPITNPTDQAIVAVDLGEHACHLAHMPPGQVATISQHPTATVAGVVRDLMPAGGLVVVELTGGLERPLLHDLEADDRYQLWIAQHTDAVSLRRLLRIPRKTDPLDAGLLARLAAMSLDPQLAAIVGDHLHPWSQLRTAIITRPAVRHLEALVKDQTRAKLRRRRRDDPFQLAQLDQYLEAMTPLIAAARAELETRAGPQERLLATLPGVSLRRAMILSAAIGDVGRFPSAGHLVRYLGLRPPLPPISGGKPIRRAKVSRSNTLLDGELHLWALTVAGHPSKTGDFGTAYLRYAAQERKRQGMWTAKRKLIRTAYAILTTGQPYHPDHQPAPRKSSAGDTPAGQVVPTS